nr:radial spoke head 1 homolog [Pocillopora verrucosa]
MGLCISVEREDFEDIVRYDGGTLLCFKHGEGTNLYENGDIYKGQWKLNQMHGHGVYTHANGEVRVVKQGYFYRNQYIGKDPGNLFTATTCCTGSCFGGAQSEPIASDEEIRKQAMKERAEQKAKKREARQRRRDEIPLKSLT